MLHGMKDMSVCKLFLLNEVNEMNKRELMSYWFSVLKEGNCKRSNVVLRLYALNNIDWKLNERFIVNSCVSDFNWMDDFVSDDRNRNETLCVWCSMLRMLHNPPSRNLPINDDIRPQANRTRFEDVVLLRPAAVRTPKAGLTRSMEIVWFFPLTSTTKCFRVRRITLNGPS